jgi:VIT1/CCC1 family predicted Fe2+/Mn2+ transporter
MSDEIKRMLDSERLSYEIYSKLEVIEHNTKLKKKLKELRNLDVNHIKIWESVYKDMGLPITKKSHRLEILSFLLLRRVFGAGLTLSVINSMENRKVSDLSKVFEDMSEKEKYKIVDYLVEELYQERLLKKESWEKGVLSHIRDVVFGMNDGLVEVLAAIAGFTGAIHNNLIIAVAGIIVGLSGTLSMAVGAYLSSKSEKDLDRDGLSRLELELQVAKERLKEDIKKHSMNYEKFDKSIDILISKLKKEKDPIYKILEKEKSNPLLKFISGEGKIFEESNALNPVKDAAYVGGFYILGAIIPLISFFVGTAVKSSPYFNLAISVVLTALAIAITSLVIALNSNEHVVKYVGRAVGLSMLAAFITFLVGHFAAVYLHILV